MSETGVLQHYSLITQYVCDQDKIRPFTDSIRCVVLCTTFWTKMIAVHIIVCITFQTKVKAVHTLVGITFQNNVKAVHIIVGNTFQTNVKADQILVRITFQTKMKAVFCLLVLLPLAFCAPHIDERFIFNSKLTAYLVFCTL